MTHHEAFCSPVIIASALLLACLIALAVTDLRHLRLPDVLTLPLIPTGLAVSVVLSGSFIDHLISATSGFLAFAGLTYAYRIKSGRTILGLGDAKLLAAGGAWCDWQMLPPIVVIASLGGLAFLVIRALVERRGLSGSTQIAFGPFLAGGIFVSWLIVVGAKGSAVAFPVWLL